MKDGPGKEAINRSLKKVNPAAPEKDSRKSLLPGLNPLKFMEVQHQQTPHCGQTLTDNYGKTANTFV